MKYLTSGQAAYRLGVSDKTFRKMVRDGKVSFNRVHPTRIEIPESEIERLISERMEQSGEDIGVIARLNQLEQRIAELESTLEKLQRARMSENTSVQTFTYEDIPATTAPSESQKKASSEQSPPKNDKTDLPDGCIHIVDFAKRYGVPDNTAKRHAQVGFRQLDGSYDRLETESRPRPGRPGQTTYFLTPQQQEKALAFWTRNGVKIVGE